MAENKKDPDVLSSEYLTTKAWPSLKKTAAEDWHAIANMVSDLPATTRYALDVASGAASKANRAIDNLPSLNLAGVKKTRPAGKTDAEIRREAALDTAVTAFVEPYTTINPKTGKREVDFAKVKDVAYNDPFKVAQDASIFISPASGTLKTTGRLLEGSAPGLAKALTVAGNATGYANAALTPQITGPALGVSLASKIAKPLISGLASLPSKYRTLSTDIPETLYGTMRQAGRESVVPTGATPSGEAYADLFNRYRSGKGSIDDIRSSLDSALNRVVENQRQKFAAGKANLSKQPVDFKNVFDVLDRLENEFKLGSPTIDPNSLPFIQRIRQGVSEIANRANPAERNIYAADRLKQDIGMLGNEISNGPQITTPIYHAVRQAIADVDPEYLKLMEQYQRGRRIANDLSKSFGAGKDSVTSIQALTKTLRQIKSPAGEDMFSQLAAESPELPYMLAGEVSRSSIPSAGLTRALEAGSMLGFGGLGIAGLTNAAMYGSPMALLGIPFQAAVSSPRAMSALEYGIGKVGGLAEKPIEVAKKVIPQPIKTAAQGAVSTVAPIVKGAAETIVPSIPLTGKYSTRAPAAGQYATQFGIAGSEQNKPLRVEEASIVPSLFTGEPLEENKTIEKPMSIEEMYGQEPSQVEEAPAPEEREGRATGGKVTHNLDSLVDDLMGKFRKAKKETDKTTEPLLNAPDEHIVKALDVAQQAI